MIDEALERLRASNPVPPEVPPPPLELILARLELDQTPRRRSRRPRLVGSAVPALGVAAAVALTVFAIVVLGRQSRPAAIPFTSRPTTGLLPMPNSGMPGVVQLDGTAFPSQGDAVISLEQCHPCRAPVRQVNRTWMVSTDNGGRSWRVIQSPAMLSTEFSGSRDGWAEGVYYRRDGGLHSGGYVTHDGGRTWVPVPLAGPVAISSVSVAGGTAWATAADSNHCSNTGECGASVLRGPASSSTLSAAPAQPLNGYAAPLLVAADAKTAYIDVFRQARPMLHLATRDAGRTWQQLPNYCPYAAVDRTLTLDSPTSLWRFCWNGGPAILLGRSSDGGRHWRSFHIPAQGRGAAPYRFQAVSSQVAWMMSDHGDVTRITNGGESTERVWSANSSQHTLVKGRPEALTAVDSKTAYVTVVIPPAKTGHAKGTYVVVYKTQDGGRTWQGLTVPLPAR